MLENFKNFVLIHYANNKKINDFWININKKVKENDFLCDIINIGSYRLLNRYDIEDIYGYSDAETFNWVLVGLNIFNSDAAKKEMKFIENIGLASNYENILVENIEKKQWLTKKEFIMYINNNT